MPPGGGGKNRGWPLKRKVDSNYSFQLLLLSRGWKYLFRKDFIWPDVKSTNDILPIQFSINFTLPTESFDTVFRYNLSPKIDTLSRFEHYFGVNLWWRTVLIPTQNAVKILTVDNPFSNGVVLLTILCRMNQVLTESNGDNEEILATACFYLRFHEHSCYELPKINSDFVPI